MGLLVLTLKRRAQRVRAAWVGYRQLRFRRIGGGGRSALRRADRTPVVLDTPVEPLLDLLDMAAAR